MQLLENFDISLIYSVTLLIRLYLISLKKLLHCNWLRAGQFSVNSNLCELFLFIFLSLHMPQARGKSVAEIAHKFSFVDHQPPSSPSHTQREDALSAATSARLAYVSSQGPVEDNLVQRSRLGSSSAHVESAPPPYPFPQVFVPPPPPPPPAFVPPPPPPPPVVPPTERVILRRKPTKKDKDRKKRDSGGPQLSMAEVIAKAKKMREQRERVLSTGSGPTSGDKETTDDPFESAMQARVVQLKSRRVEVQQAPRQEEDSELMREMRRKAQRASRAFVENEKTTHLSVEDSVFVVEGERRPSRDNSSTSNREAGDNDSLQSLETSDKLESPKQVKDFVDSLFDPVLSQGVEGLSDEVALQGALKGGGGVNQPNTTAANASTATASTAVNGHPTGQAHTQGNGYPVHPAVQAQGNGYPRMMQTNGFPAMVPGAPMYYGMPQTNGPLVGLPQASNGPVMGGPLYPANMDTALLAAQQQVLIERLIAQQALLQQQQTVASQKQQEQLLMLAQQQQSQLEQLQQMLASPQPAASPLDTQESLASSSASTSTATNGHVLSHNGQTAMEVLSPPSEFSDLRHSPPLQSPIPPPPSPLVLIPPRSTSLPPAPASTISLREQSSSNTDAFPPPPPPISDDSNTEENITPQRPGLPRRATDKVALFVAALEGKSGGEEARSPGPASPLRHGDSFSFSTTSPVRKESAAKERPEFHKRTSSSIGFVVLSDKQNSTELHPRSDGPYLSYSHVKWKLNIRKEVSLLSASSP